jgi:putative Holliday junction resolvase
MEKPANQGRILAIDLGTRRMGLALSDPGRQIGSSLGMIERRGMARDLARLRELTREREVTEIVLGLPLHLSGGESEGSRRSRAFAERLERELGLPVRLRDESLTTVEAEDILIEADLSRRKRKKVIDGMAAALILRSYLNELEERPAP